MADDRKKKRPSIYLNPPLQAIQNNLREGESLSKRLGDIAERYALIVSSARSTLDSDERLLLANALSGSLIEPLLIKHLPDEIEDALDIGEENTRRSLAAKLRDTSMAERIALIEAFEDGRLIGGE